MESRRMASGSTKETDMFTHPDVLMAQQKQHSADLIAQADQYRLLAAARRFRRARRARGEQDAMVAARGRPATASAPGNLAACGPRAAAPAR
jgi:hypothetical protein